jgi:hypothetical protein
VSVYVRDEKGVSESLRDESVLCVQPPGNLAVPSNAVPMTKSLYDGHLP